MTGVFLGYRGIHHSYAPMFVHWVLRERFGDGLVFEAGHVNQPGVHLADSIDAWLKRCAVLVTVIDQYWLDRIDLLHDESDWVRREIQYFIEHGKPIVPVLLDGAEMPKRDRMPVALADLTRRIGLPLASANAHADVLRLVGRLEQVTPDLVLAALRQPMPANATPAALLRPEYEVFPFRARPELDDLTAWATAAQGPPVHLLTGPASAGKTRLALRLCARLTPDRPTVMLPPSATPAALDRLSETDTPFLVVIDDAVSRPEVVRAAAQALATGGSAARVLLLARSAGEWLRDLIDDPDDRVSLLLSRARTTHLAALPADGGDFAVALAALGDRLGLSGPAVRTAAGPAATLVEVQALALASLDPDAEGGDHPWTRIAGRERDQWITTAAAWDLPRLRRRDINEVLAAVTLFGAADEPEARRLLAALHAFDGWRAAEIDTALALVRTMLPGPLAVNPARPQPLADEFIAEHLRHGARTTGVLGILSDDQTRRAVVALGNCLVAHPDLIEAAGHLLTGAHGRLLASAMTALPSVTDPGPLVEAMTRALPHVPADDLLGLVDALPLRSETLAGFAIALTRRALQVRPADAVTARLQRLLAVRLVFHGGPAAEAVSAAEAALRGFPEPGADRAEAYATLAQALDLQGSPAPAREAGEQAIAMFQRFAIDDPTRAALATAMINQAHRDETQTGLAVAAYEILRDLDAARPRRYRSLLADAIDLLVARTGDRDLARTAVALRRNLAAARPDAYRPALAAAAFNLAVLLGSGAEADELLRESERIFAELAAEASERYDPLLDQVRRRLEALDG
jgi:tetratricopeptide (TPR) repeat protein